MAEVTLLVRARRRGDTTPSQVLRSYSPCLKAPRKSSGFFVPLLLQTAQAETLQATGAADKPLRGRKPSADSGAKTRLGFGETLSPSDELDSLGLASTRKIPGAWGQSPQKNIAPLLSTGFADSAPSQISLFRRIHVSALNFCMSLFR